MVKKAGSGLNQILESIYSFPKAPLSKSSNRGRKRRNTTIAADPTFRNEVAADQEQGNEVSPPKITKKPKVKTNHPSQLQQQHQKSLLLLKQTNKVIIIDMKIRAIHFDAADFFLLHQQLRQLRIPVLKNSGRFGKILAKKLYPEGMALTGHLAV
ncbi:hypothetical protein QE152_g25990 [Popillia japonica]|uniref:Uncharacterized protein n=1 Tax=Popillia japonica TaxID=7064 RepID=A0AAW1JZN6_POPJA